MVVVHAMSGQQQGGGTTLEYSRLVTSGAAHALCSWYAGETNANTPNRITRSAANTSVQCGGSQSHGGGRGCCPHTRGGGDGASSTGRGVQGVWIYIACTLRGGVNNRGLQTPQRATYQRLQVGWVISSKRPRELGLAGHAARLAAKGKACCGAKGCVPYGWPAAMEGRTGAERAKGERMSHACRRWAGRWVLWVQALCTWSIRGEAATAMSIIMIMGPALHCAAAIIGEPGGAFATCKDSRFAPGTAAFAVGRQSSSSSLACEEQMPRRGLVHQMPCAEAANGPCGGTHNSLASMQKARNAKW